MIFTGIKRKSNQIFLNKRFNSLLENDLKNTSKKVEKVIVFLDDVSKLEAIKSSIKSLFQISDAAIDGFVFQKKIPKGNENESVFSPKDFGWYGKIKSERLKHILTKKYDVLINYSKVENIYSNLLLLQCKTSIRVGFSHLDNRFYDLIVECNTTDIEVFNREIKKYLEILNRA